MPYDPKRLSEDRTPAIPKPSPRGRAMGIGPVPALSGGVCRQCGKSYELGDAVWYDALTASTDSGSHDYWHNDCWQLCH